MGWWLSFNGRIGRRTWWLAYVLPLVLFAAVAAVADIALGFVRVVERDAVPLDGLAVELEGIGPFGVASLVLTVLGGLAGQVKRWHDRDRPGWWVLINLVPLVGPIWALVEVGFLRGTPGPNRFGPDPLGAAGAGGWQAAPQGQWPPQGQWHPQGQWQAPPQQPQWQPPPAQGWQPPPGQWQPPAQGPGGHPPPGWQPPPQGYPPPGYGQPPPGYGQPPPGHGQPPPGYGQPPPPGYGPPPGEPWSRPGPGGSVPPVRRD